MPRLPTIRVIGSHDISTSLLFWAGASRLGSVTVAKVSLLFLARAIVGRGMVAGGKLVAAVAPLRLLVGRLVGHRPQVADDTAVNVDEGGGHDRAGRLVHEGHELVGEAGHGTSDADAAD